MLPAAYRIVDRWQETADTTTIALEPGGEPLPRPEPGQYEMLSVAGIGEAPISVAGLTGEGRLVHTIRAVGAVTRALCAAPVGEWIGVRGPFGRGWAVASARQHDVVVVAGGIGLAPLRTLVDTFLAEPAAYGAIGLAVGAREPSELLYAGDRLRWRQAGVDVRETVDAAGEEWEGEVGLVTDVLHALELRADGARAFVCGPEPMMRFAVRTLLRLGTPAEDIEVSLERNMHCALRRCGRCQLGPYFVCWDGPVFGWPEVADLLAVDEL